MYYSTKTTVRWHDTDATLAVRPSLLLVYMQEAAMGQLDSAGQNLDSLRAWEGLAFLLTRLCLRFYAPVAPGAELTAVTWVGEGKGFNYPRYYRLQSAAGETVAEAASDWVLCELATRRPLRADEFRYNFTPEDPLPFQPCRRFGKPETMERVGERHIGYSDTDYNGHMNNTRYPDMVCDFLPESATVFRRVRQMDLTFAKEAPLGATLSVWRGEEPFSDGREDETAYLLRTENAAGDTCLFAKVLCRKETTEENH